MPKIVAPLTANGVEKLYRARVPIAVNDGAQPGLVFRYRKGGASWSVLATGAGSRVRITLGSYPETTLAKARELARSAKLRVQSSPAVSRSTLRELLGTYEQHEGGRLKTWGYQRARIGLVFAGLMERPCGSLTQHDVQRCVDAYRARVSAGNALHFIKPILRWGSKRGWLSLDWREIEAPRGAFRVRERVLTEDELKRVWSVLGGHRTDGVLRVLFWSGCRLGEAVGLRWADVTLGDDPYFDVAPDRRKTFVALRVPLSRQAAAFLGSLPRDGELVFPGRGIDWNLHRKRIQKLSGTGGWHRHDIRRTVATLVAGLGYPPHVAEAVLGHKHLSTALAGVYNRHRYYAEHREALQAVADYYSNITKL